MKVRLVYRQEVLREIDSPIIPNEDIYIGGHRYHIQAIAWNVDEGNEGCDFYTVDVMVAPVEPIRPGKTGDLYRPPGARPA